MKEYISFSDRELMSHFNKGDDRAFAEMYERYWPPIYTHAKRMLQDQAHAEDVTQDVFLKLFNQKGKLDESGSLRNYLYRSVVNSVISIIRKEKTKYNYQIKYPFNPPTEDGEEPLVTLIREELHEEIENFIGDLPQKMKRVFELSFVYELPIREIAKIEKLSKNTIKVQIRHARTKLRDRYKGVFSKFL